MTVRILSPQWSDGLSAVDRALAISGDLIEKDAAMERRLSAVDSLPLDLQDTDERL